MTKALNALSYICHQWNYGLFAYILKHMTLFYNRSIPSQSICVKQKLFFFFFHVASEHMKYFRKMPTHSHLVLTVKHFHKVSLGFWYKVISQKQKSISCHYNFLLVSLKEMIMKHSTLVGWPERRIIVILILWSIAWESEAWLCVLWGWTLNNRKCWQAAIKWLCFREMDVPSARLNWNDKPLRQRE